MRTDIIKAGTFLNKVLKNRSVFHSIHAFPEKYLRSVIGLIGEELKSGVAQFHR